MQLVVPNDPILRTNCRPDFVIRRGTVEGMLWLLRQYGGYGLAAPQVGIDARLFVTKWNEVFVNPRIVAISEPVSSVEGCLSLPGVTATLTRWNKIRLADGRTYEGEQAIVIQHEIDHLNGVLISDLSKPRIPG